ncbi:hypothetical protein AAG906_018623 [Vitis piasezkii]
MAEIRAHQDQQTAILRQIQQHLRSQLSQRRHHLYLRLPLLDHRTSLYLIKKKKEQSVSLALKPEQGPRGIWRKSLKRGALSLDWLGVTDLNAHYKGE